MLLKNFIFCPGATKWIVSNVTSQSKNQEKSQQAPILFYTSSCTTKPIDHIHYLIWVATPKSPRPSSQVVLQTAFKHAHVKHLELES